jgi:ATP/maltotriose-dependent transcriptional regulator MalT
VLDQAAGAGVQSGRSAPQPQRVVIDDAHLLPPASHRLLSARLAEDPTSMRVVLLSRWDLPISRLLPELLGNLAVIRGDVLRLDDEEARALIVAHARTASPEVVELIARHAQGWCAAAVLAARAVAVSPDPVAAARSCVEGSARLGDRIASEVFASLPARTRHLLLCLSTESVVTPRTAAHLSDDAAAGEILAELNGTGLLVSRLLSEGGADEPDTVRYHLHPLLQEVVRRRLIGDDGEVLAARATVTHAVRLDASRGRTALALARLESVRAAEQAIAVVAEHGAEMVMRGEGGSLAAFARDHGEHIGRHPGTWFPLALAAWVAGDVSAAERWLAGSLSTSDGADEDAIACARLMRARIGGEPMPPAVRFARTVVRTARAGQRSTVLLPQLLTELAITQNWLGDLHEAEANLATAIGLAQTRTLPALRAAALSHLAMTQYMLGRERACAEIARQAGEQLDQMPSWSPRFTRARVDLAVGLASAVDVPWKPPRMLDDAPVHPADLCGMFWMRVQNVHAALVTGSVAAARRLLEHPLDLPDAWRLPPHLRLVWLVEEAALAALAGDRTALRDIEHRLAAGAFRGAAGWVGGMRADLEGNRRRAVALFQAAAGDASFAQPVIRPIAMVAQAQLLDELGETEQAYAQLWQAVVETEVRRNAAPFLGWTRQGTPIQPMLARLAQRAERAWVQELAAGTASTASMPAYFDPVTATPLELANGRTAHLPVLSAREREVLRQLARGSTYADISANLFVSENTVKTHVSNLYAKLGVARRSEALAVARAHFLI